MLKASRCAGLAMLVLATWAPASAGQPREAALPQVLERVAFVGDGFVERSQQNGYVEAVLRTRWPGEIASFRNLGWSGDTVRGEARDHYTNPPGPFEHLLEQVRSVRPTTIVFGYGRDLAFEDSLLSSFVDGYHQLLDSLVVGGVRCVLLSPLPHDARTSPNPGVDELNTRLARGRDAAAGVARQYGCTFIDLYTMMTPVLSDNMKSLTEDGVQLTTEGYRQVAGIIESGLAETSRETDLRIDLDGGRSTGGEIEDNVERVRGGMRFSFSAAVLPGDSRKGRLVRLSGLPPGTHELHAGGNLLATASSVEWGKGVRVAIPSEIEQFEALRRAIVEKNHLYFRQYRPHNETYLVGFRRYEQGQHAAELVQLDPLIDEKENEIGRLSAPRPVRFTLIRQ